TLLGTITGQPIQIVSKPFSDLADAGAQIAEVQQRARAKLEAERKITQNRAELLKNANQELRANLQRLVDKIAAVAPTVKMTGAPVGLRFELGGALLEVRFGHSTPLETGMFKESGWDVLGHSIIAVGQ